MASKMKIQLQIPSIASQDSADNLTQQIKTHEPNSKVEVNVEQKTVTIETDASEESIKQMIESQGHTVK